MRKIIIQRLIAYFVEQITAEEIKGALDKVIDSIEEKVESSSSRTDDLIVLPILKALRDALDIKDND